MSRLPDNPWKMIGLLGSLGVELLVLIVGGAWLGRYLDDRWASFPTWTATGLLGGMLLGIISSVITIRYLWKK
ncbi:AtpZ/AtpI family protein [Melghirimyces algeriensis]|uniref:AtpZ/AtpI family protein n=1 Tax=Melghirimyces algeriensis TaxID=910412 RepID=UPI00163D4A25|nr:AtpZ/AtpI family protein [Melghirimyces algeriensis]